MYCHQKINNFLETCSDMDISRIILEVLPSKHSKGAVNLLADILFRYRTQDYSSLIGVFLNNKVTIEKLGKILSDMGVDVEKARYIQVTSSRKNDYIIPTYCLDSWHVWCAKGAMCKPPWAIPLEDVQEMHKAIKGETK